MTETNTPDTETTDRLTTLELVLLAGVMNVPTYQRYEHYEFWWNDSAMGRLYYGSNPFDPSADTPEGLWQAWRLVEKWRESGKTERRCVIRFSGSEVVVQLDILDVMPPGDGAIARAPTLALAICRAVLAAVRRKGASDG